jgi:MFS family permease
LDRQVDTITIVADRPLPECGKTGQDNSTIDVSVKPSPADQSARTSPYSWYVLGVLFLIYVLSVIDRNLVTVLAPYIVRDLQISDAQIGLLYGTAFALFYGLFGIALAKLADGASRVQTLAVSLCIWSAMTSLSGLATGFVGLGLARIGVGVGEASASPAAMSLLGDYFHKNRRGFAVTVYTMAVGIGAGLALVIGGAIVSAWEARFPLTSSAPFNLHGWQAAFIGVGLPGLVLALLAKATLREPVRGALDGLPQAGSQRPIAAMLAELGSMLPPWSLLRLCRCDRRAALGNAAALVCLLAGALLTSHLTSDLIAPSKRVPLAILFGTPVSSNLLQWLVLATALYSVVSWIQAVRLRDRVAYRLVAANRTFVVINLTCVALAATLYAVSSFTFLYATRYLHAAASDGALLGLIALVCGTAGMLTSGGIGDLLRARFRSARLLICVMTTLAAAGTAFLQYNTTSMPAFLVAYGLNSFFLLSWPPIINASVQDIVLPRMRGLGLAITSFASAIGLALSPYTVGLISDVTGDLRFALTAVLGVAVPLSIVGLIYLVRAIPRDEETLIARAKSAGEPLPASRLLAAE